MFTKAPSSFSEVEFSFKDAAIPQVNEAKTSFGYLGHGLLVQACLYEDKNLRGILCLLTIGEISRMFPGTSLLT